MKLNKLIAKNIYSFKDLEIDFIHKGTTLILGKNLDQGTANGAGKSSILKSLYYCLWGKEISGESLDNIRTRGSQDGTIAELEFEDRGHSYKIVRYRDRRDMPGKTGVDFYINSALFNGETAADTQKIIDRKLKISPKLFLSSILMAQNSSNHFLIANDTEKKELFSELLDLTAYGKAYDITRSDIAQKEKETAELNIKLDNISSKILERIDEIKKHEQRDDGFENDRAIKELEIKARIKQKKVDLDNATSLASGLNKAASELSLLKLESDKIKNKIKDLDSQMESESALIEVLDEIKSEELTIIKAIEVDSFRLDSLRSSLASLEDRVMRSDLNKLLVQILEFSKENGNLVSEHASLAIIFENIKDYAEKNMLGDKKEIKEIHLKVDEINSRIKEAKGALAKISAKRAKAGSKTSSFSDTRKLIGSLRLKLLETEEKIEQASVIVSKADKSRSLVEKIESDIISLEEKLSETRKADNPYKELISLSRERLDQLSLMRDGFIKVINKINKDLEYLSFWKEAFSPVGIRSFIFDEVIDKKTKGGSNNKIETKFFLSGRETSFGLLSGGEQQRAILAVNLALSEVAEIYSGTNINIKFLDEPFNGIDSSGQIQCFKLFSKISQNKDGLYVISHDEGFQQLCANSIYIVKRDGESSIVNSEDFIKKEINK